MKSLDLFLPFILPHVLGASEPLVKQCLVRAAQEFCRRTLVIQDVFTANQVAEAGEYDVDLPTQSQLLRLNAVMVGERAVALEPVVHATLPVALRGAAGGATPQVGTPTTAYFKTATGTSFWLYPLPAEDSANTITVRASYAPKLNATSLDDALYDDWLDAMSSGTLARLLATKGQPFSDPAASLMHKQMFEVEVSRGRREGTTGRIVGSPRVRGRSFA